MAYMKDRTGRRLDSFEVAPAVDIPDVRSIVTELIGGNLFATDTQSGRKTVIAEGLTITGGPVVRGEGVVFTSSEHGEQWVHINGGAARSPVWQKVMSIFGSSTADGLHSRLTTTAAGYGAPFWQGGGSGQLIQHIAARIGARPASLDAFTIPASGPVNVTVNNIPVAANAAVSFVVTVAGVQGTLAKTAGGAAFPWTFTRTTSGSETLVPQNTKAIPVFDQNYRQGVCIVNLGKNDSTGLTGALPIDQVIAIADQCIDYLGALNRNVLVMGHFTDTNTPAVSTARNNQRTLNQHYQRKYQGRFLDLGAYVTSSKVWVDTGLTPTSADLAQQALGNKPPSISTDDLHLNGAGNNAVQRLIKDRLDYLGWFPALSSALPQDTFTRANGAPGFTSTGEKAWIGTGWAIDGNQLSAAGLTGTSVLYCDTGLADLTVEADLTAIGTGAANAQGGLAIRVSDSANFWWLSTRRSSSGQGYQFFKSQAGVATAQGTSTAVAVAAPQHLKVVAAGPLLIGYVGGVEVARVTDASFNAGATGAGFMGASAGVGHRWDNFATAV